MAGEGDSRARAPELLVLGAGGLLGEVWMEAVLAGIHEAGGFDARECGSFIGTSAGSIVAATLAAGVHPRARLARVQHAPYAGQAQAGAPFSPLAQLIGVAGAVGATALAPLGALAIRSTAPAGAALRRVLLARVPRGRRSLAELGRAIERLRTAWDGRLHIVAVELASGRRVVFTGDGTGPQASVPEAVQASCAIPGVFRPLSRDGRAYVDGGVWSPTNMDVARLARGARVLCLNPTGSLRAGIGTPATALGALSRSIAGAEAFALRLGGAQVTVIGPDRASSGAMGANLLDPRPSSQVMAAGLRQGRELATTMSARA